MLMSVAKKLSYGMLDALWAVERGVTSACPVCGARILFTQVRGYGRTFLKCPSCSHIWAHDYSKLRADRGMGTQIGVDRAGEDQDDPEVGGAAEEYLSALCRETWGLQSILLYGTGPTRAFRRLREQGIDVYGCDVSPDVIAYRQREFGRERFFHVRDMGRRSYGLVVATEVIEHLFDPIPTFRRIASVLEPRGLFCGSTCFSQNGEIEDDDGFGYMRPRGHVIYWSEPSLRAAFSRVGWTLFAFSMHSEPANRHFFFGTSDSGLIGSLDDLAHESPGLPFSESFC